MAGSLTPFRCGSVNWIKWSLCGEALDQAWLASLAVQARWLARHIEWHLLGNHLLANAKALLFVGLFFDGPEARCWFERGLSIYAREISRQILADGGHFELSPMYHAIILEDLLDVVNAARVFGYAGQSVIAKLPETIQRMRAWLAVMTHPDGGPAFFNDCAFGIAPSREALEAYASRLGLASLTEPGEGTHHLVASGYMRVQQSGAVAILDVAPIGPDYLPGHAHADTLSFELSIGKERVIVNGGTSTYGSGPQRHLELIHFVPQHGRDQWRKLVRSMECVSRGPARAAFRRSHKPERRLPQSNGLPRRVSPPSRAGGSPAHLGFRA